MLAGSEHDAIYNLEALLNLYVKSFDAKAIVVLEPIATGSEQELLRELDSMRQIDFVAEYLIMHVYTSQELPARALRLMNHLGEYYAKTPVIEEHHLPLGFEPESKSDLAQREERLSSDAVLQAEPPVATQHTDLPLAEPAPEQRNKPDPTPTSLSHALHSPSELPSLATDNLPMAALAACAVLTVVLVLFMRRLLAPMGNAHK